MKGGKKCRDKRIDADAAVVLYWVNLGNATLPNLNIDLTKGRVVGLKFDNLSWKQVKH